MTDDAAPKHFWDIPPALPSGAWAEKRRLAAALRELLAIVVTTDAPAEPLADATRAAEALVRSLEGHSRRTFKQAFASCKKPSDFSPFVDRTALTGKSNPVSPPMTLHQEGDVAVGLVTFGPVFEGVPGHVHGGLVAAAFDQVFGYLQVVRNAGGMTGSLEVRYLRPTPLDTELRIEARSAGVNGRKSSVAATMTAGGVLTAEATATFVEIDAAKMQAILGVNAKREG